MTFLPYHLPNTNWCCLMIMSGGWGLFLARQAILVFFRLFSSPLLAIFISACWIGTLSMSQRFHYIARKSHTVRSYCHSEFLERLYHACEPYQVSSYQRIQSCHRPFIHHLTLPTESNRIGLCELVAEVSLYSFQIFTILQIWFGKSCKFGKR